jgi:hypothetical protein
VSRRLRPPERPPVFMHRSVTTGVRRSKDIRSRPAGWILGPVMPFGLNMHRGVSRSKISSTCHDEAWACLNAKVLRFETLSRWPHLLRRREGSSSLTGVPRPVTQVGSSLKALTSV